MFMCRPVAVTNRLIVSISVVRGCKFSASCNNMFCVFFYVIAHSAFTVSWLLHDVVLMITHIEVLDLGLLLSNSVSSFMPKLHNHARDFSLSTDSFPTSQLNCPYIGFLLNSSIFSFSVLELS